MAGHRHLKNAPITEALIDFKVILPSDFRVQDFESLSDKLCDRYPKRLEQRKYKTELQLEKDKRITQNTDYDLGGYYFKSEDEKKIAQFRKDGFSFSQLSPYTRWDDVLVKPKICGKHT